MGTTAPVAGGVLIGDHSAVLVISESFYTIVAGCGHDDRDDRYDRNDFFRMV